MFALRFLVALTILGGIAHAEKIKTNQEAKLYNHPGEQGAVLLHLKEGQTMTLLNQEGRWLKVRVLGRTGWIPRTKVDLPDNSTTARNTRRRPFVDGRSTRRGWTGGEAPDDRIGADAVGDQGTRDPGDDDDDDAKQPAAKKPATKKPAAKGDDDDDDDDAKQPAAKQPAAKKPAAHAASSAGDDDDDDDDAKQPAAKKPAAKKPAVKKPAAKGDDDDDDDAAKAPKPKAKQVAAKAKPAGDDDDDDDAVKHAAGADDPGPKRAHAHVDHKIAVYEERTTTAEVAFTAKPGETLYVDDKREDWTEIENDDGDEGWVASGDVLVDGESGAGGRHFGAKLAARTGLSFIDQSMHSIGSTKTGADQVPDQYAIKASAVSIALSGDAVYRVSKKVGLGLEFAYDGSKTVGGGIVYMGTQTGFSIDNINLRAMLDYDFQRPSGMALWFHLGLRYRAYLVSNYADPTKNAALVPQETLTAPTLGVAFALPMITPAMGIYVGLDTILFGSSIHQTAGLEDGATPSMKGVELNAQYVYHFHAFDLLATYDLDYGSYDFGGPSMESTRGHTGTDTQRSDQIHMLTIGIARGF